LAERFGQRRVRVSSERNVGDKHLRTPGQGDPEVSLADFLNEVESSKGNARYLISRNRALENNLPELLDDILNPPDFLRPSLKGAVSLWLGPEGTHTPLHHDTSHILFCQIYGKKKLRLVAPDDLALLLSPTQHTFYTSVRPEDVGAQVFEVIVEAGQGVYLPLGWWHEFVALTPSISLSFVGFQDAQPNDAYRPGSFVV
jgi:hypothetical protein